MPTTYTGKFRISKPDVGLLDWYYDYYDAMDIIDVQIPRVYMSAPRITSRSKSAGGGLTENKYYFYKVVGVKDTLVTVGSWEDVWAQADAVNKIITTNWSASIGATAYHLYRAETTDPSYIPVNSDYLLLAVVASGTSYNDNGSVVPAGVMPTTPTWYTTEIDQLMVMPDATQAHTKHITPVDIKENLNNIRHMINQLNGQANWDTNVVSSMKTIKDRVDVVCEANGDLKLEVKEKGTSETKNTQMIDFVHGLAVVVTGAKSIAIGIDEDELDFDFVRFSALGTDASAEAGKFKYYSKVIGGINELFCRDSAGNIQQFTSKGHFIGGMDKEVRMYWGLVSQIPIKWQLCDGTNGKPNLLDKFIKATQTAITNPGVTGGQHTMTLTTSHMPAHTHGISITSATESVTHTHSTSVGNQSADHSHAGSTNTAGNHLHTMRGVFLSWNAGGGWRSMSDQDPSWPRHETDAAGNHSHSVSTGGASVNHTHSVSLGNASVTHTHTVSGNTASIGSGASYDNRPAFYELCYITKI